MSEALVPVSAPSNAPAAEPATPAAPSSATPPSPAKSGRAALVEKINAAIGKAASVASQAQATDAAQPAAEATPAAETADEAPAPKAHQLAAALMKAQKAESEALKHKAAVEAAQKQLAELTATIEAAKSDPLKALGLAGMTPDQLAEMMLQGKLQASEPKPELPEEVRQLIEESKALKEAAAKAEAERQAAHYREQNLKTIGGLLEQSAAEFPLVASLPNATERLLDAIILETEALGEEPDFRDVLKRATDGVKKEAVAVLSSKAVLAELFKDDAVKAAVTEALGLANQPAEATKQPVPGAQPTRGTQARTLTSKVSGAVPSRTTKTGNTADLAARINRELFNRGV